MPSGTILNGVFAPRIHKTNASFVVENARLACDRVSKQIIGLAYATPAQEEKELLVNDVEDLLQELRDVWFREFYAQYIIDNPDECEDELED